MWKHTAFGTRPASAQAARPATAAWPQFRGNPLLTGVAPGSLPPLAVAWTHEAGGPVESSAAIAGGVVYVGVSTGHVLALDLETGRGLWSYATGAEIASVLVEAIGAGSAVAATTRVYFIERGTVKMLEARPGAVPRVVSTEGHFTTLALGPGDVLYGSGTDEHADSRVLRIDVP